MRLKPHDIWLMKHVLYYSSLCLRSRIVIIQFHYMLCRLKVPHDMGVGGGQSKLGPAPPDQVFAIADPLTMQHELTRSATFARYILFINVQTSINQNNSRQRARVVNGYDSNELHQLDIIWLRPRRFESCRCRSSNFLFAFFLLVRWVSSSRLSISPYSGRSSYSVQHTP